MKLVEFCIYRPSRQRKGKRIVQLTYRGRFRFDTDKKETDVALGLTTKDNAKAALRRLVEERENEHFGRIAPKLQRDAESKPLVEHLADFVASLRAARRSEHYAYLMGRMVTKICDECRWKYPQDVPVNAFEAWRAKNADKSLKTLNEYLNCTRAFLNWMEHCERIAANPLRKVRKHSTRGHERRKRRAYSDADLAMLTTVAGPRLLAYFLAAHAGLRRAEADKLRWADVQLEAAEPFLVVRAENAKNRREQAVPLHPELLAELKRRKPTDAKPGDLVLPDGVPSMPALRQDLSAAGIAFVDETGQRADFHALRHTFATRLAKFGAGQRARQELMRHSSPMQTEGYTDASQLLLRDAVRLLPPIQASHLASPENGFACLSVAFAGTQGKSAKPTESLENKGESHSSARNGTEGQESEDGSKGRTRTYNHPVNSRVLYH